MTLEAIDNAALRSNSVPRCRLPPPPVRDSRKIAASGSANQVLQSQYVNGIAFTEVDGAANKPAARQLDDPLLAANHFVGMPLWIPVNQALFTGNHHLSTKVDLERSADAAVRAFLSAYGVKSQGIGNSVRVSRTAKGSRNKRRAE